MYGFLSMAAKGGLEARFAVLILVINAIAMAMAGLWLLSSRTNNKPLVGPVLLLVVALVAGGFTLPLADQALQDWDLYALLSGGGSNKITVHFIDVGQGDAILIQGPDLAVLIDAGPRGAGQTVVDYLRSRGISTLDLVIATHPHEDHIGGFLDVLPEFEVREIMDPGVAHTSKTFEDYLDIIDGKDIPFTVARAGMRRNLGGGVNLEILHPLEPSEYALNNASIVTRVSYGSVNFLFTGDAEIGAEREMLERGHNLRANVLKVGHHGSVTSSSSDFLNAVRPRYGVIMVGDQNRYGHPYQQVLDQLNTGNIRVYRTDLHGTVVITTDGAGIEIRPARTADPNDILTGPSK